ncbi:MAG: hypothetical protein H8D67_14420 [Deltaproteobacteria bacterium]|nr:hypothetical protein [Deltaproteobacteria bacterium]
MTDDFDKLLKKFEEPKEEVTPEEEKLTILVVDDDESMRRGLERNLSLKYDVVTAENGKRAIEKFSNNQFYTVKLMTEHSHDGMVLEYSAFSNDKNIFRFIEKHGYAFNYHLNEPTTWGLGNPDKNKFRFHQRRVLAIDLAGTRVG